MSRLLSALCVAAQLVMACHFVLVTHTRCAHGDLVHADAHGHEVASTGEEASPLGSAEAALAAVSPLEAEHSDGHDHCVASHDRRKAIQRVASTSQVVRVLEARPLAVVTITRDVGCGLYRTAPKTSPPVA